MSHLCVLVLVLLCCYVVLMVDAKRIRNYYHDGDIVPIYYNNMGPYYNPTEVYQMQKLSFCKPGAAILLLVV